MKRLLVLLLCLAMLACVPTPEEEFVVNKGNQSEMIEASRSEDAAPDADLRLRYHIPERMTGSYTSADGVIRVNVDAEIVVPRGPLPIVRVYAAEFEQPDVTALWNALVGDAVLYDAWENEETKDDIETELKQYNEMLDRLQSGELSESDSMYSIDELNEMIAELMERYSSAPDGGEKTVETGILHKQYLPLGDDKKAASRMGISAHSEGDPWITFRVENDSDNAEALIYREKDGWSGIPARRSARFHYNRSSEKSDCYLAAYACDYAELVPVDRDDPIPEAAAGDLRMTPQEAYAEVDRFLSATGLSDRFAVSRAVVAGDTQSPDTPSEKFAYYFELSRRIGGVPVNRALLSTGSSQMNEDDYAPTWTYEQFFLVLDEDGIFIAEWKAPLTVGEPINDNAKLLDFAEIEKTAARMLPMTEVRNFDPNTSEYAERNIDRIELGLWRIAEQNELGKGMLVPVYCFYGTDSFTRTVKDAYHDFTETSCLSRIVLIVNAVDGSVIDPQKGY